MVFLSWCDDAAKLKFYKKDFIVKGDLSRYGNRTSMALRSFLYLVKRCRTANLRYFVGSKKIEMYCEREERTNIWL